MRSARLEWGAVAARWSTVRAVATRQRPLWCTEKARNPGYEGGPSKDQLHRGSRVRMSVRYPATLGVREETVLFVSRLLHAERQRRGTRTGTRALSCFKQAVLIIRWFVDGSRVA